MKLNPLNKVLFIIAVFIIAFTFTANALASGDHESIKQEKDAGPYHVIMEMQPEKIIPDETATVTINVTNREDGKAVIGAKIISKSRMAESADAKDSDMSGMENDAGMNKPIKAVMKETSGMNMEPGTYMGAITFNQPGHWEQSIQISSSLGQSSVNFPVEVDNAGPNYLFLGVVAGVVVIAAITAGFIKKHKLAEAGGTLQ